MCANSTLRGRPRRGGLAVELLFVLPILLVVLLGTVEFALWLAAQEQVALASREGARAAATGATLPEIEAVVTQVLGERRFAVTQLSAEIVDPLGQPIVPGEPVAVTVQLPARAVVPDLLVFVGWSIRNESLVSRTVLRKE